jgi:hypothetical protein
MVLGALLVEVPSRADKAQLPNATPSSNPTVVTKAMIRQMFTSDDALQRHVDPQRGVLQINHRDDESDDAEKDYPGKMISARRLCGPLLRSQLAWVRRTWNQTLSAGYEFSCQNRPEIECHMGGDHDKPSVYLRFAVDEQRGLVLGSVVTVQEAGLGESYARAADAYVRAKRDQLGATRCDSSP